MLRPHVAVRLALATALVAACKTSTGGGGHHGGNAVTYFSDNFSSGTLGEWVIDTGAPTVSPSIGEPAPSASLSGAEIKNITGAATTGGYTLSASIKLDHGFMAFRVVQPGVGPIAIVKVFRSEARYIVCATSTCDSSDVTFSGDTAWHEYAFIYEPGASRTRWLRDGQTLFASGDIGIHTGILVKAGVFAVHDTGGALGFLDNVTETSP